MRKWLNKEQTLLYVEDREGYAIVAEPHHPDWNELSKLDDILPFAVDANMALIEWRQSASLSRAEFCIALKRAGVLSAQEAKQAAKGDWPATFADALAGFPDADEAEIIWAAITTVDRMHPMLLALQAFASLPDEFVDGLFGWAAA